MRKSQIHPTTTRHRDEGYQRRRGYQQALTFEDSPTPITAKMHIPTIVAAFLLPLLALAEEANTTVTSTSYETLTRTVTLIRNASSIVTYGNSSITSHYSTGTPTALSSYVSATVTPTKPGVPAPSVIGAASSLGGAHVAVMAMAGVVVAALL